MLLHLSHLNSPFIFLRSAVFQMKVLCPKESIHSFLNCGIKDLTNETVANQNFPTAKLDALRKSMGEFDVLIIEEVSTTSAVLFVGLDGFLRKLFDQNKPFGGKTVRGSAFPLILRFFGCTFSHLWLHFVVLLLLLLV